MSPHFDHFGASFSSRPLALSCRRMLNKSTLDNACWSVHPCYCRLGVQSKNYVKEKKHRLYPSTSGVPGYIYQADVANFINHSGRLLDANFFGPQYVVLILDWIPRSWEALYVDHPSWMSSVAMLDQTRNKTPLFYSQFSTEYRTSKA